MTSNQLAHETLPFVAKLAPIGELDDTGLRMLSAGGQWSVRDGAPVVDVDVDQTPVGHITRVWVQDWALMAAGVIDPAVDLTEVKPQVDLIRFDTMMGGADQTVTIFRSAEVAAIYLGTTPAFPSVWIRHDREAGR